MKWKAGVYIGLVNTVDSKIPALHNALEYHRRQGKRYLESCGMVVNLVSSMEISRRHFESCEDAKRSGN